MLNQSICEYLAPLVYLTSEKYPLILDLSSLLTPWHHGYLFLCYKGELETWLDAKLEIKRKETSYNLL